jgi:isoquinoline 1-oxidoreductase beta subunit
VQSHDEDPIEGVPRISISVASDAAPTGVGEPGAPPVGPALADALDERVRALPPSKGGVSA